MKKTLHLFLVLLVLMSCKKESTQLADESGTAVKNEGALQNRGNGPCTKFDLQLINGVYQASFDGITVTVSNLSHMVYSNGNLLPLRDGDPAFGLLSVAPNFGEDVVLQPEMPYSHFVLSQLVWGTTTTLNYSGYMDSVYKWQTASQQNPSLPRPWPSDFMTTTTTSGSGVRLVAGKLIRSTTGSTTYALACENYPAPPPLPPLPADVFLHKSVNVNGTILNVYLHYNTGSQTVTDVSIFDSSCNPVTYTSFTSAAFTQVGTFDWSTSATVTIYWAGAPINLTGLFSNTLIPC